MAGSDFEEIRDMLEPEPFCKSKRCFDCFWKLRPEKTQEDMWHAIMEWKKRSPAGLTKIVIKC
eukprot:4177801-Karenia_brevis.AAC.1